MNPIEIGAVVALVLLQVVALLLIWRGRQPSRSDDAMRQALTALAESVRGLQAQVQRMESEIRRDLAESASRARQEQAQGIATLQQALQTQGGQQTQVQLAQLDAFAQQLQRLQGLMQDTMGQLGETQARRMTEMRDTLEVQLQQLRQSNEARLESMRATVEEKLQTTLETRLTQSFRQVAENLEKVHQGLGEMQSLSRGVGDLKHLLSNVKTRGIFGEAQLAALLEQVLTADQYAAQIATVPDSRNVVDFAIRLPGRDPASAPVWLPIDAKFPNEDYERLLQAQESADADAAAVAGKALEQRMRLEARSIAEKYVQPPHTTDFAILFLPSEGLYAEVLRRPGLMQALQQEHRITLAGPTTLLAMLSALQMGFRTLAIERRSSEVWQVLGAVKTEFGKFGDVIAKVKNQTQTVLNTLTGAETRTRAMDRALRQVQALPETESQRWLPLAADSEDTD